MELLENTQFIEFMTENIETCLSHSRHTDNYYRDLLSKESSIVDTKQYDEQTSKIVTNVSELLNEKGAFEHDILYWQGYIDCIKLLKTLQIL